jgi:hypothetical protein
MTSVTLVVLVMLPFVPRIVIWYVPRVACRFVSRVNIDGPDVSVDGANLAVVCFGKLVADRVTVPAELPTGVTVTV